MQHKEGLLACVCVEVFPTASAAALFVCSFAAGVTRFTLLVVMFAHAPHMYAPMSGPLSVSAIHAHRFQSQLPQQRRYTSVLPTLATIWREEGPRALYRGFVPKALRLGIGQSVGLLTFQRLLRAFGVDAPREVDEPEYIPVPWE